MQKRPKLTHIATAIKNNPAIWQQKVYKSWQLGNQASLGFAIGETEDSLPIALAREGYELLVEIDDFAVGTDWLTSIVVVSNCYGPWAVDITDIISLTTKAKDLIFLAKSSNINTTAVKNAH